MSMCLYVYMPVCGVYTSIVGSAHYAGLSILNAQLCNIKIILKYKNEIH